MDRVIDNSFSSLPPERWADHLRSLKEYLRSADDPNEVAKDGRSLLNIAITMAVQDDGQRLVAELLQRGADPNYPSALANFSAAMTVCNSVKLVEAMLLAKMSVNDLYAPTKESFVRSNGPFTLLDYALAVAEYVGGKKKLMAMASQTVGRSVVGGRRRFVADTIALLQQHGAKTGEELTSASA